MKQIRITDLARPVLSRVEQQLVDSAPEVTLSVEAVLSTARERTGLNDFGAEDFKERLALWLRLADEDRGLNRFGRAALLEQLVRYAACRLRVEDLLARHPEIARIPIDRPIIVSGMPRSGTTHLVNALATSPALRSMKLWESTEPVPLPGEPVSFEENDANPRYRRSVEAWRILTSVLEHFPAMHDMAPDHIHEEVELQSPDFSSYVPDWLFRAPAWQRYYFSHDQTPHYAYGKRVLQAMTWYKGPDRWLMKSPPNMENLAAILKVYPDATMIIAHRDPVAVIQSAITMIAYWDRIRRSEADLPGLAALWIDRVETTLRRCVQDRERMPAERTMDVLFHEYMADEKGTIERAWQLAGLPVNDEASRRIDAYLASNRRGRHGQVVYDLHGDFGVDVPALRRRFQFYYDRFPVARERVTGE
jgi:hypothetical protein